MPTWKDGDGGSEYLVTPEGFAFVTPWANPSYYHGVVYHLDGRVEIIQHQDHHRPFEGRKYADSLDRAKAVAEALLRLPLPDRRPTAWERLGEDDS